MCRTHPRGEHHQAGKRLLEVIFACTLLITNACSRSPQEPTVPPANRPKTKTEAPVLEQPLPDCAKPSEKSAPLNEPESSTKHHHRVVLTWIASASAKGPTDPTVGYCLYRSDKKMDITAKDLDHCKTCKRINQRPVVGTACVDHNVRDGGKYYYFAGAIRVGSALSPFSNNATAVIPSNAKSPQSASPYPSCDGENSTPTPTAAPQLPQ